MGYIKNYLTESEDSKTKERAVELQIKNRFLVVENYNNELELEVSNLEEKLIHARSSFAIKGTSDKYGDIIKLKVELNAIKDILKTSKEESVEAL